MPGALDNIPVEVPVREGGLVMRAGVVDGELLVLDVEERDRTLALELEALALLEIILVACLGPGHVMHLLLSARVRWSSGGGVSRA